MESELLKRIPQREFFYSLLLHRHFLFTKITLRVHKNILKGKFRLKGNFYCQIDALIAVLGILLLIAVYMFLLIKCVL